MDPPRETEVLVLAVDCSQYASEYPEKFERLRDVATRMERNRLLHGESKHDRIGVFKIGSETTENNIAVIKPPWYKYIECAVPADCLCVEAVRTVRGLTPGFKRVILLDVIDVLGDYLEGFDLGTAKRKRTVFFTRKGGAAYQPVDEELGELIERLGFYREQKIQLDVVCEDWTDVDDDADDLQIADEMPTRKTMRPVADIFTYSAERGIHHLWGIANATGDSIYSAADALGAVDMPLPKGKKAVAKFRGTLNIGKHVKIPVKAFITASIAGKEPAIKLSWAASVDANAPVGVHVATVRAKEVKDAKPLRDSQIVNAYPYGINLVPEQNDVGEHAWYFRLDRNDMSVIAFVSQKVVPARWFMSSVCAVISMPEYSRRVVLWMRLCKRCINQTREF